MEVVRLEVLAIENNRVRLRISFRCGEELLWEDEVPWLDVGNIFTTPIEPQVFEIDVESTH